MDKINIEQWKQCQIYERHSWGNSVTLETSNESYKQVTYAKLLNLEMKNNFIDANNKSIIDLGCGPISLLLRTNNFAHAYGVEPLDYGEEVNSNYIKKNIKIIKKPIEFITNEDFNINFDELWMYNVLEHVISPRECLEKILNIKPKKIRILDWLDIPPHEGHPFLLTENLFVETLKLKNDEYKVQHINENGCVGKCISIIKDLI